jgi:hypothetical protein
MRTYLYCLLATPADDVPAALRGVGGGAVRAIAHGPVTAWVSTVGSDTPPPTPDNARAHDRVVRAALARATPLPARFGQLFESDDALRALLAARGPSLVAALRRVEGGCEMTVRVLLGAAPPTARDAGPLPRSGREYLARVRARQNAARAARQEADFLHGRLRQAVEGLIRDESRAESTPAAYSLSVSHLVAREDVPRYRLALRALQDREPALRLMVSGPWAPYSFADPSGG